MPRTTINLRRAARAMTAAITIAAGIGSVLPTAAEAAGCGRGGGYGHSMSYRSAVRADIRPSTSTYRPAKVAAKRVAVARAEKPAGETVAESKASDPNIARKVPANAAASAAPLPSDTKPAAAKQEAGADQAVATAEAALDCKQFVPSAGVTISVPCGK